MGKAWGWNVGHDEKKYICEKDVENRQKERIGERRKYLYRHTVRNDKSIKIGTESNALQG